MTLREQVFAQAALLAGELEDGQKQMLDALCGASTAHLSARLRDGMKPEDLKADFVAAASLFALAALNEVTAGDRMEQIVAGDLTVRRESGDTASKCLYNQAELIIAPYLKDWFTFLGV